MTEFPHFRLPNSKIYMTMVHHIPSFFARALASRAQPRAVLARSIRVPRACADTAKAWQEGASRFCDWPGTVQAAPKCRRICDIFPFILIVRSFFNEFEKLVPQDACFERKNKKYVSL